MNMDRAWRILGYAVMAAVATFMLAPVTFGGVLQQFRVDRQASRMVVGVGTPPWPARTAWSMYCGCRCGWPSSQP